MTLPLTRRRRTPRTDTPDVRGGTPAPASGAQAPASGVQAPAPAPAPAAGARAPAPEPVATGTPRPAPEPPEPPEPPGAAGQPRPGPEPPNPGPGPVADTSPDPLLATKLAVPFPDPGLVRRRRLLDRLTEGTRGPLTVVTGGAGTGKTALVASWVRSGAPQGPVVWLTLDEDDAPGAFWAYVLEGLRRQGLLTDDAVGTPACPEGVDRALLVRLAAALERLTTPLVLVLDDLDKLPGRDVYTGLRFVAEHAGPALRLVLVGREDPPLALHRHRTEGSIHEIRERELAFTRREAASLLRAAGPVPDEAVVEPLLARTEGWAAGLRLCALAMARSEDPAGFARSFTATEQAVSDYLLSEVLAAQPVPSRRLLLRTGILPRVHPDLAAFLTGQADAERILRDLARAHAFVEPVNGTRWYRFHPLFAEVLRAHLRGEQPELEPLLHRRAARWFADRGRTAEAVDEAAAGGDWRYASAQAVQHLMVGPLLAGPGASPSAETFSHMPDDTPGTAAALVAAACRLAREDTAGCRTRLARAERRMIREAPRTGPAELLTAALLRLQCAPDHRAAEEAAHRVAGLMAHVPPEDRVRHPEIEPLRLYGLAGALLRAGRVRRARAVLEETVRSCTDDTTALLRHRSLGRLALAEALQGALTDATEHATASTEVADRHGILLEHRSAAADLALAAVAVDRGEAHAATVRLDAAELLPDGSSDPVLRAERAALRAEADLALGRVQAAQAALGEPAPAGAPGPEVRLAVARASAALAHGDPDTAVAALERVPDGPPSHTVALARAHLAAGRPGRALPLVRRAEEDPEATTPDRVRLALLRAHHALLEGDEGTARDRLVEALDAARPERLIRPFTEAGPWVRHLAGGLDGRREACNWLDAAPPDRAGAPVVEALSPREREVLAKVARMMSTEEIAAELQLSVNTVKTHLRGIYRKLCVSRRRDAVERARELHIL
ncbi:LuxR C-terminal-related transcriptional regulator [Streptomyces sp. NPDC089799]|uniref:LuxR C-terminal-related transcriptional regulator n=1 Tax=Streptomyces sp. NPDC089799 TaxID=3155066 RepID=UPI00341CBD85